MSSKNRQARAKEIFEKVVSNVQNIVDSGEYEKYLRFRKNFTKYSFNNSILIYSQFPDAIRVAGKKAWKDLGRETISSAKPISIIAGMPKKGEKKTKKIVNGKEIEEIETYDYMSYRTVYVYDISQTTGDDFPLQIKTIDSENMGEFYDKLKCFSKYPIYEKELNINLHGYYSPTQKSITLNKKLSLDDKVATLLHELVHGLYDDFDYKTNKDLSEVFVESIAFIVADYFGLDTSMCSFRYITKYAKGDPKVVIELGNKIQKCSKEFIEQIENFEVQEELAA